MKKMSQQLAQDAAAVGVKAAPGVVVAATGATGAINWSDIAYMLTAFYVVAQILLLLPQYRKMYRDWRNKGEKGCE